MRRAIRIEPGPGQESVWDYPRPPRLERSEAHVRVALDDAVIADSVRAWRVLETSQPPAFYIPLDDVDRAHLRASDAQTFCEWKGSASYFDVVAGDRVVARGAWYYATPTPAFAPIADHVAFYPQHLACSVDGEPVEPNEGSFYGGWITSKVVGPFKGGPGTTGW